MIETITVVGSLASIVGLLLPAKGWKARLIHVIYGIVIVMLSLGYFNYREQLGRVHSVERAAKRLIEQKKMEYTDAGYVQAVLTLLEKNKDIYPDAYARAKELYEAYDGNKSKYKKEGLGELEHDFGMIDLAYQMDGILKGLIAVNTKS